MTRPDAKWRRSTVQCGRLSVPISGWSQQSDAVSASSMSISTTIDVINNNVSSYLCSNSHHTSKKPLENHGDYEFVAKPAKFNRLYLLRDWILEAVSYMKHVQQDLNITNPWSK